MHSTDDLKDGYLGSGKRLWFSINYHGRQNHTKEIIEFCSTRERLKIREREIVNEQLISENLCMNLMVGGQGGIINEEHQKKMRAGASKWMRGQWKNKEFSKKMNKLSGERMMQHHKDGKITVPDWTGKKHSEESIKLMSEKAKERTGSKNSQFGTCWITKDGANKKIKKEEIDIYLNLGWNKGRV